MLMGMLSLLLIATVPVFRGDLRKLATLELSATWLLPVALGLQVLVITVAPGLPRPFTVGVHLVTYLLAAAFLWSNRRVAGLLLLAAGAATNGVVIAVNGGTLPASEAALRRAGLPTDLPGFTNSASLESPRLAWLGDVFAIPAGIPFANVFSVGDVLILAGAAWLLHSTCRRRGAHETSRSARPGRRQPRRLRLRADDRRSGTPVVR